MKEQMHAMKEKKCNVKRMYEAYLVTETDNDDGDETSAQDWW